MLHGPGHSTEECKVLKKMSGKAKKAFEAKKKKHDDGGTANLMALLEEMKAKVAKCESRLDKKDVTETYNQLDELNLDSEE